jgi:hypothetical protein
MMIEKGAVEAIAGLAPGAVVKELEGGVKTLCLRKEDGSWETAAVGVPPRPTETLEVATLDALVEYVQMNRDSVLSGELLVVVDGADKVRLVGPLDKAWGTRPTYVEVEPMLPELPLGFRLNGYVSHESFMVGLQAAFAEGGDRAAILSFAGRIEDGNTLKLEDDGITQSIEVKQGAVFREKAEVKRIVSLAPYRTFPEIAQPASIFLLRLKSGAGENAQPSLALFEADGGAWKVQAIKAVAEYLRGKLEGVPVLA